MAEAAEEVLVAGARQGVRQRQLDTSLLRYTYYGVTYYGDASLLRYVHCMYTTHTHSAMMHSSMPHGGGAASEAEDTKEVVPGGTLHAARRAGRQLYLAGPEGQFFGFGRALEELNLSTQAVQQAQGSSSQQPTRPATPH